VLVAGRHFQPNLIFVPKARSPMRGYTLVGLALALRLDWTNIDEHCRLLRYIFSTRNFFYCTGWCSLQFQDFSTCKYKHAVL